MKTSSKISVGLLISFIVFILIAIWSTFSNDINWAIHKSSFINRCAQFDQKIYTDSIADCKNYINKCTDYIVENNDRLNHNNQLLNVYNSSDLYISGFLSNVDTKNSEIEYAIKGLEETNEKLQQKIDYYEKVLKALTYRSSSDTTWIKFEQKYKTEWINRK